MRMRFFVTGALAVCLAAPATALAGEPTETDKTNAAKECKAEGSKYKNAFGKCVSSRAKDEQAKRKSAKSKASRECRAERAELGVEAFRAKYGTERSKGRNAFGKCVSQHAKKHRKAADRADRKEMRSKAQA